MYILSLIALSMITKVSANGHLALSSYMVVCPDAVRPGMEFTVQFNKLPNFPNVSTYQFIAEIINGNESIDKREVTLNSAIMSSQLMLKLPQNLPSADYKLEVEAKNDVETIFKDSTFLRYTSKGFSILMQTDRAIYRPGQKVQFRAFGANPDLSILFGKMDIGVFDPNNNKIDQWLNKEESSGVFQGELQLSDNTVLGDWKIDVELHGSSKSIMFTVAEYVLPRFEVIIEVPSFGLTSNKYLSGKVEAKYTIGKGVKGNGELIIKRKNNANKEYRLAFQLTGEYEFHVQLKALVKLFGKLNYVELELVAEVTEALTGNTQSGSTEITFYDTGVKLVFLDGASNFKPGLSYTCYLFLSDRDDKPLSQMDYKVSVSVSMTLEAIAKKKKSKPKNNVKGPKIIPSNGIIPVTLSIPMHVTSITINAMYGELQTSKQLQKFQSKTDIYIQVSVNTKNPQAGKKCGFRIQSTIRKIKINYLIISKGMIVKAGMLTLKKKTSTLTIVLSADMAPSARIVVYWVTSKGEVIGDSRQFNVEGFFENKVDIEFLNQKGKVTKEGEPHQKVQIRVTADPGSQCNVLAIDKRVLLLKSGNDITTAKVQEELESYDSRPPSPCREFFPCLRMLFPFPIPGVDVTRMFKNSGLKVMSDAFLYQHGPDYEIFESQAQMREGEVTARARVRKNFPETWIYDSATANAKGKAIIKSTVPDTLTTWVASAFAVNNETGLGVAPDTANFLSFLKFFIRLDLPYSVTRGEQVILQASVFNFFSYELQVDVVLKKSKAFENIIISGSGTSKVMVQKSVQVTRTITVKPGDATTVYLPIVPVKIGDIDILVKATSQKASDAVKKNLLVEPEGIPQDYNIAVLIDLTNSSSFQKVVMITLPDNYIEDSARIRITAKGDLMGPDISGLSNLLRMPYGCGEQNLINLVPNIFVLNYLTAVNKLKPEDKAKGIGFMRAGYQTELTYQRMDGSFSAFGNNDAAGSTWLTAFVVKSFAQAAQYIFVDSAVMTKAITYLQQRYNEAGGFRELGRVIHTDMQGGSGSGEQRLAAYTIIALKEAVSAGLWNLKRQTLQPKFSSSTPPSDLALIISHAISIMEGEVPSMEDIFDLAITGYAMALDNNINVDTILAKLEMKATTEDGMKYWVVEEEPDVSGLRWIPPHVQASSRNIEVTAYVLLIYAIKGDIVNGLSVVKWLVNQRNGLGGFGSTQDTVIALQALAEFATLIYSPHGCTLSIDITGTPTSFSHRFLIGSENALILQSVDAPGDTKSFTISATGSGIGLVEFAVDYNVLLDFLEPFFELQLTVKDEETFNAFTLQICFRWLGDDESGMAILEVGLLSGFIAEKSGVTDLDLIDKIDDTENKKLVIYLQKVPGDKTTCLDVPMRRDEAVAGPKPAVVKLCDYYKPNKRVAGLYESPLLKDDDVCRLGGEELGC